MKKLASTFIILFPMFIISIGCILKTKGENVEDSVENVADEIEDAVE